MFKKFAHIVFSLLLISNLIGTNINFAYAKGPDTTKPTKMVPLPKPSALPGIQEGATDKDQITKAFFSSITTFTKGFLGITGLAALILMIISGVLFLISWGDEEKITKAKDTAKYAAIGFFISMLSYAIVAIIVTLPYAPNG